MEFAIGQVNVKLTIKNFSWGTRSIEIKLNGTVAGCKLSGEITISENNRPLDINIILQKEESNEEKSIK